MLNPKFYMLPEGSYVHSQGGFLGARRSFPESMKLAKYFGGIEI